MENVLDRANELVQQFQSSEKGFAELQENMRAALKGPFAEEIFGTEQSPLQTAVEQMKPDDHVAVNTTIHNFSKALLLKHEALLRIASAAA